MKEYLKFIVKYSTVGLAAGFIYLLVSGQFNPKSAMIEPPQLVFSYAPAINKITPSVVSIHTQSNELITPRKTGVSPRTPFMTRNYLGSGVIVSPSGHIATNNHVIDGASRVVVYLWDNQPYEASFVGSDPITDLAVIKIDAQDLIPADFADSDLINTGDVVLAVGNPFGLNQSASLGIVSATGRHGLTESQYIQLENYIQTDAAINQGNSGGPLINPLGQVVGISTSSYSQYGAEGINFATPSNTTVQIINDLIQYGKVPRGWLGIHFIPPYGHAIYNIPKPTTGIMVAKVHENGSAANAGIKPYDVITHVDGQPFFNFDEYRKILYTHTIGDEVTIKGQNDHGEFEMTLVVEAPPKPQQ
ncbi:MAG: S1C family serine protease [Marinicella sp.]